MTEREMLFNELWSQLQISPFMMLALADGDAHHEPMTVRFDSTIPGSLFVYTHADNRLVRGLESGLGPSCEASATYVSEKNDYFASLRGTLSVCDDSWLFDLLWSNAVEAWFEQGKSDPTIRMLRFDIKSVELWKADMSLKGKLKMLFGGTLDKDTLEQKHAHASV